jgi:hypothetical protein
VTVATAEAVHGAPPAWVSWVHVAVKVSAPGAAGVKSTFRCVVSSYCGSRVSARPGGPAIWIDGSVTDVRLPPSTPMKSATRCVAATDCVGDVPASSVNSKRSGGT